MGVSIRECGEQNAAFDVGLITDGLQTPEKGIEVWGPEKPLTTLELQSNSTKIAMRKTRPVR